MKKQNNKFLTFLESVQNNNNANIITAITRAYNILEASELMVIEGEEVKDQIPGGPAGDYKSSEFDSEQLAMGLIVEMENIDDPKIALEMAMDHLIESDDYYTRLAQMEVEIESDDDDDTDTDTDERSELTEAKKKKKKRKKQKKARKWTPFKGSRMLGIGYPFIGSFSDGGDSGFGDGGGFGGDGGGGGGGGE